MNRNHKLDKGGTWRVRSENENAVTMYGAQFPKSDVDGLYLRRYERGRGMIGLKDFVQEKTHNLERYLSTLKEKIKSQQNH